MNRSHYHSTARFKAQRKFRNGWHTIDGSITNLRIGDRVLLNNKWVDVIF